MSSLEKLDLMLYTKKMLFLFFLGVAISMTGIQVFARQLEAVTHPPVVTMNETDSSHVAEVLSDFVGEDIKSATVVKRGNGAYTTDLDTAQGFHRFILEQVEDSWVITDAWRL